MKAMALRPADRYPSAQALGQDVERWLADEPVSARREPLQRAGAALDATPPDGRGRDRRGLGRRHRPGSPPCSSSRPKPTPSSSRPTSTWPSSIRQTQEANRALELANDRERARFELALEAIKTFHGQVSEDLLLKEKQFDGLRTKMLESATDFYQRLEDLLKEQADQRSRAALGQAYHDIGELTAKIGSQAEALAALKRGPGAASGPGGRAGGESRRRSRNAGDSLIAVGDVQEATGDLTGALASYEQARDLLEPLVQSKPDNAD